MPEFPYLQWPVFRRSVVAAFRRSLTPSNPVDMRELSRRNRYGLKQKSVEEKSLPFFRSRKLPLMTFRIYAAIEKGLRAPHFDELEALYLTFVDATGLAVEFSPFVFVLFSRVSRISRFILSAFCISRF